MVTREQETFARDGVSACVSAVPLRRRSAADTVLPIVAQKPWKFTLKTCRFSDWHCHVQCGKRMALCETDIKWRFAKVYGSAELGTTKMNSISPLIRRIVAAPCADSIEIIITLCACNVPFIVWVRDQKCGGIVSFIKSLQSSAISTMFSIQLKPKELFELDFFFHPPLPITIYFPAHGQFIVSGTSWFCPFCEKQFHKKKSR